MEDLERRRESYPVTIHSESESGKILFNRVAQKGEKGI
jgi:hypothetical protein